MNIRTYLYLFLLFVIVACNNDSETVKLADGLVVSWGVIENGVAEKNQFRATFTLTNNSTETLENNGWSLYYNHIMGGAVDGTVEGGVAIEHISGYYYKLIPTTAFQALAPNESVTITYLSNNWAIKETDAPTGLYWVFENGDGTEQKPVLVKELTTLPFTTAKQLNRNASDKFPIPTPEYVYHQNEGLTTLNLDKNSSIIPTPINYTWKENQVSITSNSTIFYQNGLKEEADYLNEILKNKLGKALGIEESVISEKEPNQIYLEFGYQGIKGKQQEAYQLSVLPNEGDYIAIKGSDRAGVFYGIQSLIASFDMMTYPQSDEEIKVNGRIVEDAPRFPYRGMHLDVARNFQSKASVMRLLDIMALYKLNKFHFHLTDDEGWRLAIKDLPELTEIGAKRGHTLDERTMLFPAYGSGPDPSNPQGTGYYSRADYIEILKYAKARHIEVIPEIDLPGHARAAIKAMEARYYQLKGTDESQAEQATKAQQYLLSEPTDSSSYMSVQNYDDNVICICQESVYNFLRVVTEDIVNMHKEANALLTTLHIGGDEVPNGVWEKAPSCLDLVKEGKVASTSKRDLFNYFLKRFDKILKEYSLVTAGWEEIAAYHPEEGGLLPNPEFVNSQFLPYVWNAVFGWGGEDLGYQLANAGYPVVLCNASNLYFDFAYNKDPEEPGFYWAGFANTQSPYAFEPYDLFKTASMGRFGEKLDPTVLAKGKTKLTAKGKKNILGIQGQLWTETVTSAEAMEYYILPKLIGLAERAWAKEPQWATITDTEAMREVLANDWNTFANIVGQQDMKRLEYLFDNMNYRIPTAGVFIKDNMVAANVAFPGLDIRYTTDGTEPTIDSKKYEKPITRVTNIKFRVFNSVGRGGRSVLIP